MVGGRATHPVLRRGDASTVLGRTVVVRGLEYIGDSQSFGLATLFIGSQDPAWRSDDGAATVTPMDLTASQTYTVSRHAPTDPAACK